MIKSNDYQSTNWNIPQIHKSPLTTQPVGDVSLTIASVILAEQPPSCQPSFSRWSACSSTCGSGLSSRRSNLNARCQPATETRICQTRRCQDTQLPPANDHHNRQHHLRVSNYLISYHLCDQFSLSTKLK